MKKIFLTLSLLIFATSCAGNRDEKMQKDLGKIWDNYFEKNFSDTGSISVFIATDRKSKDNNFGCSNDQFGVNFDSKIWFGVCEVNVPKNHSTGEISFAKDGRQSSHDYFKILAAKSMEKKDLLKVLEQTNRAPLVFVHGFNVRYQEAILRASQIAYDLKYQGPILLFTWPAGASDGFFDDAILNKTYENNLAAARASIPVFKNFLLDLAEHGIKINLMVHSMGHQVVLSALKQLSEEKKEVLINELILNAPDFDVKEFANFSDKIKSSSKRVTLYCSYNDKAMMVSKTFNKSDRLGACSLFDGFDVINVSLIDDPAISLGHGYYSSRAILSDVFQTLLGIDAQKRLFIKNSEPNSSERYFLRQ